MTSSTVLVTGGSARIGAAIVQAFADNAWHVVIHYGESQDEAEALASTLPSAETVHCDLADGDAAVTMVEALAARLPDCSLYVTLEPCPMCATAISFARLKLLYYGAPDPKGGGVEHGARIFHQTTCHHKPELYPGIGEAEAATLLRAFFQARR